MRRKCAGRVRIPGGSRPCKLPPQAGSEFCHQHSTATQPLPSPPPARRSKPPPSTQARPGAQPTASPAGPSFNTGRAATGCVRDILSLIASGDVWDGILGALSENFSQSQIIEQMALKDLYVTEAIRSAIVPSQACPEALVVFKGGTSLAKAYPILHRFSEDVDVNIVPPPDQRFGDSRRKKARRELHARLEAGIPLPMEHERHGTNFATTTIHYPPVTSGTAGGSPGGLVFGEVLVEMNIRGQPPATCGSQTVASLAGEAAARLDPALLREHPLLQPFEVLTADPMIAVVDKLGCPSLAQQLRRPRPGARPGPRHLRPRLPVAPRDSASSSQQPASRRAARDRRGLHPPGTHCSGNSTAGRRVRGLASLPARTPRL